MSLLHPQFTTGDGIVVVPGEQLFFVVVERDGTMLRQVRVVSAIVSSVVADGRASVTLGTSRHGVDDRVTWIIADCFARPGSALARRVLSALPGIPPEGSAIGDDPGPREAQALLGRMGRDAGASRGAAVPGGDS